MENKYDLTQLQEFKNKKKEIEDLRFKKQIINSIIKKYKIDKNKANDIFEKLKKKYILRANIFFSVWIIFNLFLFFIGVILSASFQSPWPMLYVIFIGIFINFFIIFPISSCVFIGEKYYIMNNI